jgi:hypothetical protein
MRFGYAVVTRFLAGCYFSAKSNFRRINNRIQVAEFDKRIKSKRIGFSHPIRLKFQMVFQLIYYKISNFYDEKTSNKKPIIVAQISLRYSTDFDAF